MKQEEKEWFDKKLEEVTSKYSEMHYRRQRQKYYGRYLYVITKENPEPIERAIYWYLSLRGFGKHRLLTTRKDYYDLRKVEAEIDDFLIQEGMLDFTIFDEWRNLNEGFKEVMQKIKKKDEKAKETLPRFCPFCNLNEVYCGCEL